MKAKNSDLKKAVAKHKEVILLFSIPLLIMLIALLAMLSMRLLAQPKYDFIYASCPSYYCGDRYILNDGQIERELQSGTGTTPNDLYIYSINDDSTRRITMSEAQEYQLDGSSRSPDGYSLNHERSRDSGFLLFYSSTSGGWQLEKDWFNRPVSLDGSEWSIDKIGWVIE